VSASHLPLRVRDQPFGTTSLVSRFARSLLVMAAFVCHGSSRRRISSKSELRSDRVQCPLGIGSTSPSDFSSRLSSVRNGLVERCKSFQIPVVGRSLYPAGLCDSECSIAKRETARNVTQYFSCFVDGVAIIIACRLQGLQKLVGGRHSPAILQAAYFKSVED
jgi:hypothetical protein